MDTLSVETAKPTKASGGFEWSDPFLLDDQLNEEERLIRETAHAYAQEKLLPRGNGSLVLSQRWHPDAVKTVRVGGSGPCSTSRAASENAPLLPSTSSTNSPPETVPVATAILNGQCANQRRIVAGSPLAS